ncbi:hypothetical protein FFF34_000450 [Inquilinus sp. KBS0705]|nr:hypothetical protein FFF34_000450 [Inquilinus sp. KBS0705]
MMRKILPLVLLATICLAACNKATHKPGCPTNQVCTALFATVNVAFVDKDGQIVNVKNVTITNLRTDSAIVIDNITGPSISPHIITIATDANRQQFSTEGDNVRVVATDVVTNKTATAMFKISGGCNCHVDKVAGPDKIVFE